MTLVTSVTAAIWGFGFVGWLGQPVEPFIMVVPLLLVARSFSHCVQFTERFYEVYHHVRDKRKAAEISMGVMMAPGTLGIVTDAEYDQRLAEVSAALADLRDTRTMSGGTSTFSESWGQLVYRVGSDTQTARAEQQSRHEVVAQVARLRAWLEAVSH